MSIYTGRQYKLRAASPMPTNSSGDFVLHSFMAAMQDSIVDSCTMDLPSSSSFIGQGGDLNSASFSRLPLSGGQYFQGKTAMGLQYVEENTTG